MNSEITWDNLEYFKNFDNAKKTDCKMELKKLGVYKKGMMKDLVRLLEFANYKKKIKFIWLEMKIYLILFKFL